MYKLKQTGLVRLVEPPAIYKIDCLLVLVTPHIPFICFPG